MARGRGRGGPATPAQPAPATHAAVSAGLVAALAADPAASAAAAALARDGELFIVGGAVRDILLGLTPKDVDLLVRGVPAGHVESVLGELPGDTKLTGADFGVFRYATEGAEVEIALPRRERSTGDRHTDFEVEADHTIPLTDDLLRRDFTANAMAFDLATGELLDPHGGRADIAAGVLRCVSALSFVEDPLRILRGLRAHARHGLVPDEDTRAQMAANAGRLSHLSAERIGEEWEKLLETSAPRAGMALARETGVVGALITELPPSPAPQALIAAEQALAAVCTVNQDPDVRAAAYLSELEPLAPGLTADYLERVKWPKRRAGRISHLIGCLDEAPAADELAARRLLARLGKEEADAFLGLRASRAADSAAGAAAGLEAALVAQTIASEHAVSIPELAVDGTDLIASGIAPGPALGQTLRDLLERVILEPGLNRRDTLLALAGSR